MPDHAVAIVGGGITGLVAAFTLQTENPDIDVVLLEASDRLGGKLRTERLHGIQIEAGADSFLARTTDAPDLCRELGLEDELVAPAVFGGAVWRDGKAKRIPPGTVMGVPTSARAIVRADPLSTAGKIRAMGDLILPGRLQGNDVSVAELIGRRFGKQVLDRLVDPLLAGTRAGAAHEMSLRAALPEIDRAARSHSSVMVGLRRGSGARTAAPAFFAPRGGMTRLVEALRRRLTDVEIKTGARVDRILEARRGGYVVHRDGGESIEAMSVILTVPSHIAAEILRDTNGSAAVGLTRIAHASVASITLVYPAGTMRFPRGTSGFLVPSGEGRLLSAGTWWSLKWPHAVPDSLDVVRCFVGRAGRHPALDGDDNRLIEAASRELNELLGGDAVPSDGTVARWDEGLPQYEVGHLGRVSRIEGALERSEGIVLAGADYRGSGIPDCIAQARRAARRVVAGL